MSKYFKSCSVVLFLQKRRRIIHEVESDDERTQDGRDEKENAAQLFNGSDNVSY